MGKKNLEIYILRHTYDPEELVAMAAKLCYSDADISALKEGVQEKDQEKFLNKLIDMGHFTPLEHVSFTFGIEGVSRSLLAQITRHRIASFSVKSQRYVVEKSSSGKDGFGYIIPPRIEALGEEYIKKYEEQMEQMQKWYDFWYDTLGGLKEEAPEDARFVLPNAAETKMVMTMNARELNHFFRLRCCTRAQWEIRNLAIEMLRLVKEIAPVLFKGAGPGCVSSSCPEGRMSCGKAVATRENFLQL